MGCTAISEDKAVYSESAAVSLGRLVILVDRHRSYEMDENPFGSEKVFLSFKQEYETQIKQLHIEQRVDFLWGSMWHLSFDGDNMAEFQEIVAGDCGDVFVSRLKRYVETEKRLNRSKSRLFLSEQVLAGLMDLLNARKSQ